MTVDVDLVKVIVGRADTRDREPQFDEHKKQQRDQDDCNESK